MRKNRLGKTELDVTTLGFGGIPIQRISRQEALQVLARALEHGINYFDTARAYSDSEKKMGEALKDVRSEVIISTKGIRRGAAQTRQDIETSLRNLRTDYIDIYFIHDISREGDRDRILAPDGALAAAQEARDKGLIRHLAISSHRPEIMADLLRTEAFEVAMIPVNIVDKYFMDEVVPLAREMDIGLVVMKPFAGGALDDAPICLRYALDQGLDTVIPGMQSVDELDENVAIAESFKPLTEAEREQLEEAAKALGEHFCRQCGYCQPCPKGINIPRVFLLDRYYRRYWLKDVAQKKYTAMDVQADACEDCGECETRCPYFLPIREMLEEAHSRLS
jgi:hypothetical protein